MKLKSIVAIAIAVLNISSFGTVLVENFEGAKSNVYINLAQKRKQHFAITKSPGGKGKTGLLSWDIKRFRYAVIMMKKPVKLPKFETEAVLTVKIYTLADCPVNRFNLRLIDAKGEVFQWNKGVSWSKSGWKQLVFKVTPAGVSCSWGGKNDKKFDQPFRFLGFAIDFKKDSGAGKLWIDDITFSASGGDKVLSKKKALSFDQSERWYLKSYVGTGKIESRDALTLTGNARVYTLRERMWELKSFAKPESFTLHTALKNGNAKIIFAFRGRKNKYVETPALKLSSGNNVNKIKLGKVLAKLNSPIKLYQIKIKTSGQALNLELKQLDMFSIIPAVDAIKTEVITGNPVHVLKAGEEKKLKLQFTNTALKPLAFKASIRLENFYGENISFSRVFSLPSQTTQTWAVPAIPAKYGIWWVHYSLTDLNAKDSVRYGQLSFAYMQPAGPTKGISPGFLFGMCTHTERWGKRDHELEVLATALCGAKIIRTGSSWGSIQASLGQWNWDLMDRMVKLYGDKGIEIQYVLAFTPKWAAAKNKQQSKNWRDWNRSAPEINAWRKYASTIAKRYKNQIRYWEIWNEPDWNTFGRFTVGEYVKMMKAAYKEIKKVDSALRVMTGGFATLRDHPGRKDKNFHQTVLIDAKGYFDVHAYHEHGPFGRYADVIDNKFIPLRKKTNTKIPWYANETAICSMDGAEKQQAETLFKKLLFSWTRGAIGYNWYDLRNDGFDPRNAEHTFGMMTNDFYPKAVYPVYNTLARYFKGMKFDHQLDLGNNLWAFIFGDRRGLIIPAWNEASAEATRHIVIKTDAAKAEMLDLMGNTTLVPIINHMAILEVGSVPGALRLLRASKAKVVGRLTQVAALGTAVPGKKLNFSINLFNPLASTKEFELSLVLPEGISGNECVRNVKVPSLGKSTLSYNLRVSPKFKGKYELKPKIRLFYEIKGTTWSGSITIPVNLAISIPEGGFKRTPDFVLASRRQVITLCGGDPAKAHLIWKDAKDLGAKIWLSSDSKNLLLKVVVSDDVHIQPYQGLRVWKGDNIQFALQVPKQVGLWEIGLSRLDKGQGEVFVWSAAKGFDCKKAAKQIKLKTSRESGRTNYSAVIPLKAFGLSSALLKHGIRFNLLVNDNDKNIREGWIQIAPGIGTGKDSAKFPFIVFP